MIDFTGRDWLRHLPKNASIKRFDLTRKAEFLAAVAIGRALRSLGLWIGL